MPEDLKSVLKCCIQPQDPVIAPVLEIRVENPLLREAASLAGIKSPIVTASSQHDKFAAAQKMMKSTPEGTLARMQRVDGIRTVIIR